MKFRKYSCSFFALCVVIFAVAWFGNRSDRNEKVSRQAVQNSPKPALPARDDDLTSDLQPIEIENEPVLVTNVIYTAQEEKLLDITFDDLKFDIEKDGDYEESMLTGEIRKMVGRQIKIRGFIQPSFKQKGIRTFVFVRDNKECCFGPGAALYDCMIVKLKKGKSTSFTVRPIAVAGEFVIKEYKDPDGKVRAIFRINDGIVEK